jgi:SAM-dependent methyltransferase
VTDFAPIAATLRREVGAHLGAAAAAGPGPAATTLETNSTLAERRGRLLLDLLARARGSADMRGARVIDVGCGYGALAALFAAEGAHVTAIDMDASRFTVGRAVAERHGLDITFVAARMEALDAIGHAGFDVGVMNNSLCYLTGDGARGRALRELLRVLAPGGTAIVRDPNRLSPVDPFTGLPLVGMLPPRAAARVLRRAGVRRSEVTLASRRGAVRELRDAGFEAVRALDPPRAGGPPVPPALARYHHVVGRRPLA